MRAGGPRCAFVSGPVLHCSPLSRRMLLSLVLVLACNTSARTIDLACEAERSRGGADECYKRAALGAKKPELCNSIASDDVYSQCMYDLGVKLQRGDICEEILDVTAAE